MSYYDWFIAHGAGVPSPEDAEGSSNSAVSYTGDVTQEFGAIAVSGGWVLPAPKLPAQYENINLLVRDTSERSFRWQAVVAPPNLPVGLDYKKAYAYRLEITPDLGHQNPDLLFQPYDAAQQTGNPRLKTFDFLVPGVELDAEIDHLTYEVGQDDWNRLINPRFHRYLWRVVAQTEEGVAGFPSDFASFEVLADVPVSSWSIDPLPKPQEFVQVVAGTKNPEITDIEVLGQSPTVQFPTPNTWRIEVPLVGADSTLFIRAVDKAGNASAYQAVSVELTTVTSEDWQIWNTFDELGLLVGTERHRGEDNVDYKTRILDTYKHRGSPRYLGIRNALTRELEVLGDQEDRALLIQRNMSVGQGQNPAEVAIIAFGSRKVHVWGEEFRKKLERHMVNGNDFSVTLNKSIEDDEPVIECPLGSPVSNLNFSIDQDENKILFSDPDMAGKEIYISYQYRETIEYADMTLSQLETALEAIQLNGNQVLAVDVKTGFEGKSAALLDQVQPSPVYDRIYYDASGAEVNALPVRWSPVQIYALNDEEYQESFENAFGNLFNTVINSFATQLATIAGIHWGNVTADESRFFPVEVMRGMSGLPTTADWPMAYFKPAVGSEEYDIEEYIGLSGLAEDGSKLILVGIPDNLLKSGVGSQDDLLVTVKKTNVASLDTPVVESPVVQVLESDLQDLSDDTAAGSGTFNPDDYAG